MKDHGIGVNRQFDVYTTDSVSYPAEAPPVYQKDQPLNGSALTVIKAPPAPESSKLPSSKFILKTVSHAPTQPVNVELNQSRQSEEVRRSLQLPKVDPVSNHLKFPSNIEPICDAPIRPKNPHDVILHCELTGASMEFTQPDDTMPGGMGLQKGASTCTIRVTSKKKCTARGEIRAVRSIWIIAESGKLCIQHKLPQESLIIPYTLWSNELKVIIRRPSKIRYFTNLKSNSPYKTTHTSWVNYRFDSVSTSADFQSALLSPFQLITTIPTTRTVRLHNSPFVRAFSSRLQLCGLENLRMFRDATDPNSLVCMIHYSPNFRPVNDEEYILFRLYPPPRNSVRIREDGEKCVKIKGLDIRGSPANEQAKKGKAPQSKVERLEEEAYGSHSIEKIKIEFESRKEKQQFLQMTRELQGLSSW
ncbi:MAG: hypothetical protein Q9170_001633 [Blastenia crenularia]